MPPSRRDLTLIQGNTEDLEVAVTSGRAAYDLTGATVTFLIKDTRQTPDADARASLTTGDGITAVDLAGGKVKVAVPASATGTAGEFWYRVDVAKSGATRTAAFGPLFIEDV